ncbi:MAG: sigma-70 family RNA polymerase sigma factor [Chitinispirillaceae bacterium]|nr:sigma-70 family RNA polymerase sigma factor [Chitinispirillaceae bacterium]
MATPTPWQQIRQFFSSEYHALVAFVRSLIDDAAERDAEDIVQDVAYHFFEKGDIGEPIKHLGAYVYQSLRNRVVDSFRRRKPVDSLEAPMAGGMEDGLRLVDVLRESSHDPGYTAENRDLFDKAMTLIRELPVREQAVIIATEIEGCSFAELSERWEVPIGTLLSQKSRSLKKIRKQLQSIV